MPITIITPPTNNGFGPGFSIGLESSFTGPISFPFYIVTVETEPGANNLSLQDTLIPTSGSGFPASGNFHVTPSFLGVRALANEGSTVNLRVTLNGSAGTVETIDQAIKLDRQTGLIDQAVRQLAGITGTVSGGATASQVTTLQSDVTVLKQSILPELPGFAGTLMNLVTGNPPIGQITRELIGDFTDCGSLTRVAFGQQVDAFGIAWEVISFGGGIGIDPIVPQRFETLLLSLEMRHTDHDGHQFTSNFTDVNYSNGYYFFSPPLPSLINYCIAPSVTMRFYWLLVTL